MFFLFGQINDSIRMYEDTEPCQFDHCWVVLRGELKWHEKMAETNMEQKANQKHSQDSKIEINTMHTGSALPERPEGWDSAKKRSRMMGYTSSSSTAVEMLQKMHERGEKNDEKED
jgi:(2Fe-2S) ferredoxin